MRFKRPMKPKKGCKRIRKVFALFPIDTVLEIAWLETVYLEEEYLQDWYDYSLGWCTFGFTTKELYEEFKARTNRERPWVTKEEFFDMIGVGHETD